MSIYATLWTLKFPREGEETIGCEWITVRAQAVPAHVGTPTPGHGYEGGDPYAGFLPPAVELDGQGSAPHDRALVFVTEHSIKGTERNQGVRFLIDEVRAEQPWTEDRPQATIHKASGVLNYGNSKSHRNPSRGDSHE